MHAYIANCFLKSQKVCTLSPSHSKLAASHFLWVFPSFSESVKRPTRQRDVRQGVRLQLILF